MPVGPVKTAAAALGGGRFDAESGLPEDLSFLPRSGAVSEEDIWGKTKGDQTRIGRANTADNLLFDPV